MPTFNLSASFIFREATNNDVTLIKHLIFAVLDEYRLLPDEFGKDSDLSDLQRNYFTQNGFFGLIICGQLNKVVGTFGITKVNEESCELRKMYVAKEFRGRGIGKFMLGQAVAIARERNYKFIQLETVSVLKEAIDLYVKFGFKEILPAKVSDRVDRAFKLNL